MRKHFNETAELAGATLLLICAVLAALNVIESLHAIIGLSAGALLWSGAKIHRITKDGVDLDHD